MIKTLKPEREKTKGIGKEDMRLRGILQLRGTRKGSKPRKPIQLD
jgi:hypothetical protein